MILKSKGLDYVKEHGVYRVAPAEAINKEVELELEKKKKLSDLRQLVVRLIPVNYADADKLHESADAIKPATAVNTTSIMMRGFSS